MSSKYIEMYGLGIALNLMDVFGTDNASGKQPGAFCCTHAFPGGHRDGG